MPRRVALAASLLCAACAAARPAPSGARRVGDPLELAAQDLGGGAVDVAADRGRVRVVDFWATWCAPCREELPALAAMEKDLRSRGLSVYAVSFDEDRSLIAPFLASTGPAPRVLWDPGGDRWAAVYEVERLPTTLVVDRRGIIRFVHQGYDARTAAAQRREVEALLSEP